MFDLAKGYYSVSTLYIFFYYFTYLKKIFFKYFYFWESQDLSFSPSILDNDDDDNDDDDDDNDDEDDHHVDHDTYIHIKPFCDTDTFQFTYAITNVLFVKK